MMEFKYSRHYPPRPNHAFPPWISNLLVLLGLIAGLLFAGNSLAVQHHRMQVVEAWHTVVDAAGLPGDLGRSNALKVLNPPNNWTCSFNPFCGYARQSLVGINLYGSYLPDTNFNQADLRDAILAFADLEGSSFAGARLDGAVLTGANLRHASGLTEQQLNSAAYICETRLPSYVSVGSDRDCYREEQFDDLPPHETSHSATDMFSVRLG